MSKLRPPAGAGEERLTVKVNEVVPESPSFWVTLLIDRFVPTGLGVIEKSSTARPSSAPLASISVHRIQTQSPLGMFRPVIVELSAVRRAAAFPFLAPITDVSGVTKFSAVTLVHVPVVRSVASKLYWKLIWSVRVAVPFRHSSPLYATASDVIVLPVPLLNAAPKIGLSVPLRRLPRAR